MSIRITKVLSVLPRSRTTALLLAPFEQLGKDPQIIIINWRRLCCCETTVWWIHMTMADNNNNNNRNNIPDVALDDRPAVVRPGEERRVRRRREIMALRLPPVPPDNHHPILVDDDLMMDMDNHNNNIQANNNGGHNPDDEEDAVDDEAFLLGEDEQPEEHAEHPQRPAQNNNNNNNNNEPAAAAAAINNPQQRRRQLLQRRLLVALRVVFGNFLRQRTTLELHNFRLKRTLLDAILRKLRVVCGNEIPQSQQVSHHASCPFPTALSLHNCKFSDGGAARFGDLLEYLSPSLRQVSIGYPSAAMMMSSNNNNNNNNVFVVVQHHQQAVQNGAPADQFPRAPGQEPPPNNNRAARNDHANGGNGNDNNNNNHLNNNNNNALPPPDPAVSARAQRLRQRQLRRAQAPQPQEEPVVGADTNNNNGPGAHAPEPARRPQHPQQGNDVNGEQQQQEQQQHVVRGRDAAAVAADNANHPLEQEEDDVRAHLQNRVAAAAQWVAEAGGQRPGNLVAAVLAPMGNENPNNHHDDDARGIQQQPQQRGLRDMMEIIGPVQQQIAQALRNARRGMNDFANNNNNEDEDLFLHNPPDLAQWFEEHMAHPAAAILGHQPMIRLGNHNIRRGQDDNHNGAANNNNNNNNNNNPAAANPDHPRGAAPNNRPVAADGNHQGNRNHQGTANNNNNTTTNASKLLTHDHAVALLTGLLSCTNLEKLQLQGLGLRNEGIVRLLCTVIKNCEHLETINLQACRFNTRSMYQLTQAFCLIPITQQYLPQQALQDQLQFPKRKLRSPTLQHLRLTESEWINDNMLHLLLRDVALHCTALKTFDLSGNPCITAAGALSSLTSFLLKHSTIEEFKVQLALPKSMIPVTSPSTQRGSSSAPPPQRVICEDLPDSFLLENFCSAVRQHPSLKHLQISASIQRPEASTSNSPATVLPNNTVAPPPEMAVSLLRVAIQASCRLQTLKLPKLLHYYKNKKEHPNWQINGQSLTGGLASARQRLKAFRFDTDTTIEADETHGSESLLEIFGQDEATSPSYPNEKATRILWKGLMNLSDLSRRMILWNHTGTSPHFADMGNAVSRLVLNGQLCQLRCDGSHKEVPLNSLLGSCASTLNDPADLKLHTLELIQVPIVKSQFESVSDTPGSLMHQVLRAKCLKSFSLHRNLLTAHTLPLWTKLLRTNPQLMHLCLSGNPNLFLAPLEESGQARTNGEESRKNHKDFVAAVEEHDCLQSLNLYYCGLKKSPLAIDLITSFDTNDTRKLLKLDFCSVRRSVNRKLRMIMSYFADELTQDLVRGLRSMRNVESIQMNNWDRRNRIRFQELLPVVLSPEMRIQEFAVNSLNSPRPGTQSFLPVLADSLEQHPSLHTLRLNGQDMSDTREGRLSVLNALSTRNAPKLLVLSLHRMSLTSDYMEPLARLVRHQDQLEELAILSCPVMREDYDNVQTVISSLLEALTRHPSLKRLSLRDCIWHSTTLMHFFQAMRNSKIEMLDMGWGCLDPKISEWTESIPHLKNLKYLKVPRDLWTDERWTLFVERLRRNKSICKIQYDSARMVIFAHELKEPDTIWGGSDIPDKDVKNILRRNQMLKHSEMLVRKPVDSSVAPRVLHLFGSNGEGSAIYTFLRSFHSASGSWNGVSVHAKKRGRNNDQANGSSNPLIDEVTTRSPSAKRRRVCSSPTAAASSTVSSDGAAANSASDSETYASTLEKVRSEIWLNHGGTVALKDLLQILGLKKSTATPQLKKVIRQLCDMKKKGSSNVLVLKPQYQFQRKRPPPSS